MPDADPRPPVPAAVEGIEPLDDFDRFRTEVTLDDGGSVLLRPIRPDDKSALEEGFDRLSRDSIYRRFFGPKHELTDKELAYLTELDFHGHVALVAIVPEDQQADTPEQPAAVGRYVVLEGEDLPTAELAITVTDEHQGRGIGGLLFDHLCRMARAQGIEAFVGNVLDENRAMRGLLESHGRIVDESWQGDGLRMTVMLDECGAGRGTS